MECPKCGYSQSQSDECISCGIIISKYNARRSNGSGLSRPPSAPARDHSSKLPIKTFIISLLVIVFITYSAVNWWKSRPVVHGPGVVAPNPPEQTVTETAPFTFHEYRITPLADFHVNARVLSKENYFWGRDGDLVPVDLALGWGRMSDESVLKNIKITQSHRFYFWSTKNFPISGKEIETHSANMHLIPADSDVLKQIKNTRKGDVVDFKGYLVQAEYKKGKWRWKSSLTRNDTGNGACELVFVEDFKIE